MCIEAVLTRVHDSCLNQFPVWRYLNLSAAVAVLGEMGPLRQVGPALSTCTHILVVYLLSNVSLRVEVFLWHTRQRLFGEQLGCFWVVVGVS